MRRRASKRAIVGVADHAGWAVLVTATPEGTLLDRRRVDLVDAELPKLPHHHDAQGLPVREAISLIERVRAPANDHATACLDALARDLALDPAGIALRKCPPLPPTIPERLENYRAQNVADTVMYREALAAAAEQKGWFVHWYQTKTVVAQAARALKAKDMEKFLEQVRVSIGPPWQKDHRTALAAAIAASAVV